jgi:hypothetical protein
MSFIGPMITGRNCRNRRRRSRGHRARHWRFALILTVPPRLKRGAGLGTDQGMERRLPIRVRARRLHILANRSRKHSVSGRGFDRPRGQGRAGRGTWHLSLGQLCIAGHVTAHEGWALRSGPAAPADQRPPSRRHHRPWPSGRRRARAGSTRGAAGELMHSEAAQGSRHCPRVQASRRSGGMLSCSLQRARQRICPSRRR